MPSSEDGGDDYVDESGGGDDVDESGGDDDGDLFDHVMHTRRFN